MRKTITVAPTPAQLIATIRSTAEPLMEAYQTDLAHDETWITRHPGTAFVFDGRRLYACGINEAIEDYDRALERARNESRRIRAGRAARRTDRRLGRASSAGSADLLRAREGALRKG